MENQFAKFGQHRADVVLLAGRDATAADHHIGTLARLAQRFAQGTWGIGDDAQIDDAALLLLEQGARA